MTRKQDSCCISGLRTFFALFIFVSLAMIVCGCSNPSIGTYTVGGTVSGLSGTGLVLQNYGNNLAVTANGSFTFAAAVQNGGPYSGNYNVSVLTQPSNPTQICDVVNGTGSASTSITNIQVACSTITYTVGGTVSGLTGTGLQLQDNGNDNLLVNANGGFTFATAIVSGGTYSVTLLAQPSSSPPQVCNVTNGSGTASANITSVQVTCTAAKYTIGGGVINLAANSSLQLQDNGGDTLLVKGNGPFTFPTALVVENSYDVTVSVQPASPAQNCVIANGTGTATANITTVIVNCGQSNWIWVDGSNVEGQDGTYGTLPPAAGNPSARDGAVRWTDTLGNFWLFGGSGVDSSGNNGMLNDLWEYSGGQWTWMTGSSSAGEKGTYGNKGMAATGNTPGARLDAVSWTDTSGNLWLFGGYGLDSADNTGFLNDLWEYSGGKWAWIGGSNLANQQGTYGNEGTAAPGNIPGPRDDAVAWTDASGNAWLFGGNGLIVFSGSNYYGFLNDLWEYSGGQWTWVGGTNQLNEQGIYEAEHTAGRPGARQFATGWRDVSGNLWLFGGKGLDSAGNYGFLNDLWEYSGGQWIWMGGADLISQQGSYGTVATAASSNNPGARYSAVAWTDKSGNFWLFGGNGYGSTGNYGFLNDLWEYSAGQWTWMGGSNLINEQGNYGTLGVAGQVNVPGARQAAVGWTDTTGNFWFFGGQGVDSTGAEGFLNDLWEYKP